MGMAKPLHLRLFIEGQEVPVISAQVQAGLWAPASAAVQIIPIEEALHFKPRTMVHLFFLEEPMARGQSTREDLSGNLKSKLADESYKLLFSGEIIGFSFVKTPMSRAVVLQCLDFSSYWDFLQLTMMDYGKDGNAFVHRASVYASDETLVAELPGKQLATVIQQWLWSKPQTPGLETVDGLAGGIISLMERVGGIRNHRLGVNDFFTIAELRCHLLAQIGAEEKDNTSKRLFDVTHFFNWLEGSLGSAGGQISLRDVFKLLCQYIFYAIAPNPVAYMEDIKSRKKKVTVSRKLKPLADHPKFPSVFAIVEAVVQTFSQDSVEVGPARRMETDVNDFLLPLVKALPAFDQSVVQKCDTLSTTLNTYVRTVGVTGEQASFMPHEIERALLAVRAAAAAVKDVFDGIGLANYEEVSTSSAIEDISYKRLKTQIFRPDCFMAAPPTCNVIFPEQYANLSYDRSFLQEATRVHLSNYSRLVVGGTNPTNKDALLASHILEPHLTDATKEIAKNIRNPWRVLMDHELHTGIIAVEEWLPDSFAAIPSMGAKGAQASSLNWQQKTGLHHFFKYRIGQRSVNVSGRFMPYVVTGFPGLVIQKPFSSRDLESVADETVYDLIRKNDLALRTTMPEQFLGMVESVAHSLSQEGATTSISMSHCRTHLGADDEFVNQMLTKLQQKKTVSVPREYDLTYSKVSEGKDLTAYNFLKDCTPQQDLESPVQEVSVRTTTKNKASYQSKTMVGGFVQTETKTVDVSSSSVGMSKATEVGVPVVDSNPPAFKLDNFETIKIPASGAHITVGSKGLRGGKISKIQVVTPNIQIDSKGQKFFSAIKVFEMVPIPMNSDQDIELPVEYVIQPAWLSSSYDNYNVGPKVYESFFGCGSIVDPIRPSDVPIGDLRRTSEGVPSTAAEDEKAFESRIKAIENNRNYLSIEKAVNIISFMYGRVKSRGLDVDEFVETFTRRPVASKKDMLGSYDLVLEVQGSKVIRTAGSVGFHTMSVHPVPVMAGKLIGLLDDPAMKASRMGETAKRALAASYDVRRAKLEKVLAYVKALSGERLGFVG